VDDFGPRSTDVIVSPRWAAAGVARTRTTMAQAAVSSLLVADLRVLENIFLLLQYPISEDS
jgi:hypothetical protein